MTIQNNLLIFGTNNFNNSLSEIKDYLNFSLFFFDKQASFDSMLSRTNLVLVDSAICNDVDMRNIIIKIKNKPILLLESEQVPVTNKILHSEITKLPLNLHEISTKITNLITTKKYRQNSSVQIKEYILDKNKRKLNKKNLSITITEREIQLIELLFNENKPLSKSIILDKVWKYADDTDTHTIETHIYRLRKKILSKFKDENFIINSKAGYTI